MTNDNFKLARQVMANYFTKNPGCRLTYVANIAMLLHDHHGITNHKKRNAAANDIMNLIFNT
ncbi:hypothetical protein LCGC14_2400790 [marine sediment metagenome]|uniref:Uncharacterized protein n=1 Tax=marine sediment metagenome TaxID=412755 RepID=A0A0F9BVD4_9ZZZZ